MIRRLITLTVVLVIALAALPAFAQDGKQDGQKGTDSSGASVVILKFETFNTEQAVMDHFYTALHDAIEAHPDMHVKPGGDVSINDLILTLGCESANAQCLQGLSDFVEGDRIVYGSVQHSEDVYLLSLKMFDFSEGEFIREVSDETVEGNVDQIKAGIDAVIEGFLYGDVGTLEVNISGAPKAQIYFDGKKMGPAPATLDNLPLGEHAVSVETAAGQKQSKKVVLHRGSTSRIQFNFETGEVGAGEPVASSDYAVPGWAATGLGTVGLVAGIVGTMQLSSYSSEADSMVCGDALCPAASTDRANKLQSDMDSAYTLSVVGYSVAAVGLAAGGYLLYETYTGSSAEAAPDAGGEADDAPSVSFSVAPSPDGASVGMRVGF